MKQFILTALLSLLTLTALGQSRTVQFSNLDTNRLSTNGYTVSLVKYNPTNLYVIAYRTDGIKGKGTMTDPFDGSTSNKLDTLFANAPTNAFIFLMPSTNVYVASGYPVFSLKYGQHVIGGGMEATTIKFAPAVADLGFRGVVKDGSIENLSINCNGNGGAVAVSSDGNFHIKNVHAFNSGSPSGGEKFILAIDSDTDHFGDSIEGCIVDQYAGGANGATAISLQGGPGRIGYGGKIINNTVVFTNANTASFDFCYQVSGVKDALISGNHAYGGTRGFYWDTYALTNITISGNVFSSGGYSNYATSIMLNGGPSKNIRIFDNVFVIGPSGTAIQTTTSGTQYGLVIQNNEVRYFDPTNTFGTGFNLSGLSGVKINGNIIRVGVTNNVSTTVTNAFGAFNTDDNGTNIAALTLATTTVNNLSASSVVLAQQTDAYVTTNVTINASQALHYLLLTNSTTYLPAPSNMAAGQSFTVHLVQDSTGTRAVAFDRAWRFPSGQTLTTTTNANSQDILSCITGPYGTNVLVVQTLNFTQ